MGTGSVVYGWNGTSLRRVGGWGYLLDDAGSGYDIGREALLAAFAHADGLSPVSEVARLVEIKLGGPISENSSKIYTEGKSFIASFCPVVFEAMAAGDELATKIITGSASRFADLINHMYRLGEYGNRVIISGGLATHGEVMSRLVKERLDENIVVEISDLPPVFGAMRTCMALDGVKIDYDNFKKQFACN
jgi:N-acetylglucosamine kinase-like BadF-type ATPase